MDDPFPDEDESEAEKAASEELRRSLEGVLATRQGRRLMWTLICDTGAGVAVSGERQAGRQEVGLELISKIRACNHAFYINMLEENDK